MKSITTEIYGPKNRMILVAVWAAVMVCAILAYMPGLAGPFLFDDFGSIKPLGDFGGVTDWESFKVFVFGGHAGPTGRPLALLSFLVDGNGWPTDPWPFKRTNLLIHLITGTTLGILVTLVLKCVQIKRRDAQWIALVATAIWILHPFLVSTTLYIVQRMAQLAALFMFAGLSLYLHGRLKTVTDPRRAYLTMSAAIAVFTLLATFSKENGLLLPVLVGVVELTVVASQRDRLPALNRPWAIVFIAVPSAVVFLYLGSLFLNNGFFDIAPRRDFSMYERFLTQGRVLIDYLQHWYLPKLYTTGVFQDHFIKSTGLFAPVTTVLSFLLHAALIGFAFVKRRELPLLALAILFFYASHLLESTVVNLELYFEHRNYVAAAFLFLPLVEYGFRKASLHIFAVVGIAVLLLVGSFTRYSATVWQSFPSMIESSALKAPTSARAQVQFATILFNAGLVDEAIGVIDQAIATIPNKDQQLLTAKLYILCSRNRLDAAVFDSIATRLSTLPFDSRSLSTYKGFAQEIVTGACPNIDLTRVDTFLSRMLDVPANANPRSLAYSHINYLIGFVRVHSGQPQAAMDAFQQSLDARGGPTHVMLMAALMASNGFNREALVLANRAQQQLRSDISQNPRLTPKVKESDIEQFMETVKSDLADAQKPGTSGPVE